MVLTGPTGSGKTTTLALVVNLLNQTGGYRIITVEEPVEYQFPRAANSVVTQREVGKDVRSFADGLRAGLRQDPDVILVGEVRDHETANGPDAPPRPGTWSSRRCTRGTPRGRSPGSPTCSRRTPRPRSGPNSR